MRNSQRDSNVSTAWTRREDAQTEGQTGLRSGDSPLATVFNHRGERRQQGPRFSVLIPTISLPALLANDLVREQFAAVLSADRILARLILRLLGIGSTTYRRLRTLCK
jgi:hypothetical protein